jgi:phosphoglycolate phosphatase
VSRFSPILFDLDGTIADTRPGIVAAVNEALRELGLPSIDAELVHGAIGRGVDALARSVTSASVAPAFADGYRRTYARSCLSGTILYPGVRELIRELDAPLGLITNKPRAFTEMILAHFELAQRFAVVIAGDDDRPERLKPDPWPIREALARFGATDPHPIFIADGEKDVAAAEAANVPCCLVTWGYERADAKRAAFSVSTVEELRVLIERGAR